MRSGRVVASLLVLASIVALVAGAHAASSAGWWADGLRWLVVDHVAATFDRLAVPVLVGTLVVAVWRWWRGQMPTPGALDRRAVALVAAVACLRLLVRWIAPEPTGPNVVLISIDTLRADKLGCYGQRRPTTPVIDERLAGQGVLFEQVWSQSPKTTPSHMTMLTSLYPSVHGVTMWEGTDERAVLNPKVHTLAEVLKNAGYTTAAFTADGPMHRSRGFDHGFDVYRHGAQLSRAVHWLDGRPAGRFFLFFHTYDVHDPYLPPEAQIDRFAPEYRGPLRDVVRRLRSQHDGWDAAHKTFWDAVDRRDAEAVAFVERLYEAGIRQMDDTTLTTLLGALDRLGLARDTLVVLTSDHGEAFLEHGRFLHEDVYTETTRVPLIVRWPGRLPAGRRVTTPAGVIDVMPTILDLVGVPGPTAMQGTSRAAAVRGEDGRPASDGTPQTNAVISEYGTHQAGVFQKAIRLDGESLVAVEGVRLFDLRTDPGEHRDLAPERPTRVHALQTHLDVVRDACTALTPRFGPTGDGVAPDDETVRRLRALGYVE